MVGATHRSCAPSIRELLATEPRELPAVQARLRAAGLKESVWISTCDRVELVAAHPDPAAVKVAATALLAERAGLAPSALAESLHCLVDEDAVRHVFAVASALDSQVLGEPQVLGQIKAAYRDTVEGGLSGPSVEALMQAAFAAAKRVRTETAIAAGPVSIAAAAVQTARDLHGDLARCGLLLVGLGDMGMLIAEALRDAGLARVTVAARNAGRAEAAAHRLGGHWLSPEAVPDALPQADVVVTATGLGRWTVTAECVATALRRRRSQPMLVVDAAVPGDVEPTVAALADAFVYEVADLERIATEGQAGRAEAARAAWMIVGEAARAFVRSRAERAAVPAVAALRRRFEDERLRLLAEAPGLDAAEATRLLVNRLLHGPSEALRRLAAEGPAGGGEELQAERLLARLFPSEEKSEET